MIVTRAPYRVSFFGGGTDYWEWYKEYGGDILSATINHYCYVGCWHSLSLSLCVKHKKTVRDISECACDTNKVLYNAVREALKFCNVSQELEITYRHDLPSRSGLGSSSSFYAALVQSILALKNEMTTKYELTKKTMHLEREILKENGGIQDQIASVYGGLNHIHINPNGSFSVNPVLINDERKETFNNHLMLFFTGMSRTSSDIAEKQVKTLKDKFEQLSRMQEMVSEACHILTSKNEDLDNFGRMLHETWMLKRSLTDKISNSLIDEIYQVAIENGALGGKLLGAGSGGFILFYAPPEKHEKIKSALKKLTYVPFKFCREGCKVICATG